MPQTSSATHAGTEARREDVEVVGAELVALGVDARPDEGVDALRAERPHGGDGGRQHAGDQAAPAGVGGADDALGG